MTDRVQRAIDTLLDAINNRTLAKGTCVACAVGNLVAKGMGAEIERITHPKQTSFQCNEDNGYWGKLFYTSHGYQKRLITDEKWEKNAMENIKATEFSLAELMAIEFAFETNTEISWEHYHRHSDEEIKKDQIKGLEAVINVMMDFDDIKEDVKEVFTKKVKIESVFA